MTSQTPETIRTEVESFLRGVLEILEEEVAFDIDIDAEGEIYVNLTGSLYILSEDRSILSALEQLLRVALRTRVGKECDVILDAHGAARRRRADLVRFALDAADSARQEHRRIRLSPMPSGDRRMIHIALANFPGVRTYSTGKGDERRVVIEPETG
jgi:spoIIIJ-associated protein